jgi:thymidylate synthase
MFEGVILCFAFFVVGYVLLMHLMARRVDVLHGEYIESIGRSDGLPLA